MIETSPVGVTDLPRDAEAERVAAIYAPTAQETQSVSSESLLGRRGELKIQHNGEQYSLRRTRHGKLILTK